MSFLCPRPMDKEGLSGHMESSVTAHPGQCWGQGRLSSGSLWLISVSPATLKRGILGRKYDTPQRIKGPRQSRLQWYQGNIQLSDLEGHKKGRGTRQACSGLLGGAPAGTPAARSQEEPKGIRLQAKRMCFAGKVGGEK